MHIFLWTIWLINVYNLNSQVFFCVLFLFFILFEFLIYVVYSIFICVGFFFLTYLTSILSLSCSHSGSFSVSLSVCSIVISGVAEFHCVQVVNTCSMRVRKMHVLRGRGREGGREKKRTRRRQRDTQTETKMKQASERENNRQRESVCVCGKKHTKINNI